MSEAIIIEIRPLIENSFEQLATLVSVLQSSGGSVSADDKNTQNILNYAIKKAHSALTKALSIVNKSKDCYGRSCESLSSQISICEKELRAAEVNLRQSSSRQSDLTVSINKKMQDINNMEERRREVQLKKEREEMSEGQAIVTGILSGIAIVGTFGLATPVVVGLLAVYAKELSDLTDRLNQHQREINGLKEQLQSLQREKEESENAVAMAKENQHKLRSQLNQQNEEFRSIVRLNEWLALTCIKVAGLQAPVNVMHTMTRYLVDYESVSDCLEHLMETLNRNDDPALESLIEFSSVKRFCLEYKKLNFKSIGQ